MSPIAASSACRSIRPKRLNWSMAAKDRLSRSDIGIISPSVLRSSGMSAIPPPGRLVLRGLESITALPLTATDPPTPVRAPNSANRRSRWPWPSSPPSPTTSPGRTSKSMFLRRPAHDRFVTLRTGGWVDFWAGRGGNTLFTSRPIIISMISLGLLLPAVKVATWQPLR